MVVKGHYGKGVEKTDGGRGGGDESIGTSLSLFIRIACVLTSLSRACFASMFRGCSKVGWQWPLVGVVVLAACVGGSEFPERECCDPVYPPNTATTAAAPVTYPVSKAGQLGKFQRENDST
ncbi:unnamed protein product, partial [Iphiclides podalirius]